MDALQVRNRINRDIMALAAETPAVSATQNIRIPHEERDIPARVYTPEGASPFPLLIYIHGAGWVAGSLDTHDNICRRLAADVPCVVLSVGYSLAPESRFPVQVQESYQALVWAAGHAPSLNADAQRLAVAGDSAGGNLAAAVSLMAHYRGQPEVGFQLLVNPALDLTRYEGEEFEQLAWFRSQYLTDEIEAGHPYASPLLAKSVEGVPPAFIITGELDNLCAEGEEYGERLREAGVAANTYRMAATGHLSGHYARATDEAQEAVALSVVVLRAAFKRQDGAGQAE
jgi:acetyl esterase